MSDLALEERPVEQPKKSGGTPVREYVVLEALAFEDTNEPYFVQIGSVEARNAANALRKAYYEFKGETVGDTTLIAVPRTLWRPTPVKGKSRDGIVVSVGS